MRIFLALIALALLAGCTTTPLKPTPSPLGVKSCGKIPNSQYGRYCVWKSQCPVVKGTLDYDHGLGENETAPDAPGNPITPAHTEFQAMAAANCLNLRSISYSRPDKDMVIPFVGTAHEGWMTRPQLTSAKTPPSPAWSEYNAALDTIDKLENLQGPHFAFGQSMGGFNAAVSAAYRPDYYKKVLLTHPVMGDFPNLDACPLGQLICNTYQLLVGANFWTSEWVIANPVANAKTVQVMPSLYVMSCPDDSFGLWKGPKAFADILKSRGFDVTFEASPSGCAHTDSPSAAAQKWIQP